jgi:hypothetical protein
MNMIFPIRLTSCEIELAKFDLGFAAIHKRCVRQNLAGLPF